MLKKYIPTIIWLKLLAISSCCSCLLSLYMQCWYMSCWDWRTSTRSSRLCSVWEVLTSTTTPGKTWRHQRQRASRSYTPQHNSSNNSAWMGWTSPGSTQMLTVCHPPPFTLHLTGSQCYIANTIAIVALAEVTETQHHVWQVPLLASSIFHSKVLELKVGSLMFSCGLLVRYCWAELNYGKYDLSCLKYRHSKLKTLILLYFWY